MKKKKKVIILVTIAFIICLIGILIYSNDQLHFKISYEYINYMEYDNGKKIKVSIPINNKIKYISNNELVDILNSKTGIIYFGYNTCPWCRNAIPVLIDTIRKNNIEKVYYADIHKLKLSEIKEELYLKLDSYLELNEEGIKGISVPSVYFLVNGKIVCNHTGTVDSYHNPYNEMTEDEKKELSNIYNNCIEEMKK